MREPGARKFFPSVAAILVPMDLMILYAAFVGALGVRIGEWLFLPEPFEAFAITIAAYMTALLLSGIYRMRPSQLHLDGFLRSAAALLVAWAASLTLIYLIVPATMPPRSVTAVQCVFSIVGILGLRAVIRYVQEFGHVRRPTDNGEALSEMSGAEFLNRAEFTIEESNLRDYLSGRTVLVTGAGGSVGAELCKRLIALQPFRLVLVDVSEYNLYQLENELRNQLFEGELQFRIADVRDESIMRVIFSAYRPDIVFHAAAYKHVPLMERHPVEAFRNNTLSTVSLIRLCEAFDAEQFVFISTDKAVEPASVLGATKRLAEWYVRAVDASMPCKTVRFGNVLGSQGSVMPLFIEQIAQGGPVTITHPDMRRFFMTAHESCSLILQTLLLNDAPVYTLEMGEPITIESLARKMIDHLAPGAPTPIAYAGIRPGEKLIEQLWSEEETPVPTLNPRIIGLQSNAPFSRAELDSYFAYLELLCEENRTAEVRRALFETRLSAFIPEHSSIYPSQSD